MDQKGERQLEHEASVWSCFHREGEEIREKQHHCGKQGMERKERMRGRSSVLEQNSLLAGLAYQYRLSLKTVFELVQTEKVEVSGTFPGTNTRSSPLEQPLATSTLLTIPDMIWESRCAGDHSSHIACT